MARAADQTVECDRGAAALRDRGKRALRQGRRDHGAEGAARSAAGAAPGRPRDATDRRQGEGEASRLLVCEHGLARRARRVRHVGRPRSHALKRLISLGVLALAAVGIATYLHGGIPDFIQRLRYPLRYEAIVRGHARHYDLDPALLAAVIDQESTFHA